MLSNLIVENYALISKLDIDFKKGLTIITGETGAGKSILLGALALILGKRADSSVLYNKEKKCIVEGSFDLEGYGLQQFFTIHDIDYDNQTTIRREISSAGKSRAFINDTPVNLDVLSDLGLQLIDIHSQHQNLHLANSRFQMKVIDSIAGNHASLSKYQQALSELKELEKRYQQLSDNAERLKSDLDYMEFQYTQLSEAKLKEEEQEELEIEQERLAHAEEIKTGLTSIALMLQEDQNAVLQQLKESLGIINRIEKFLHTNGDLPQRLESSYIELKDIAQETELLNARVSSDPDRLALINERINLIYNLLSKHNRKSISELLELQEDFRKKIEQTSAIDVNLEELRQKITEIRDIVSQHAEELHERRKNSIPSAEKQITDMLQQVGMPNASYKIHLEKKDDFFDNGSDHIQFLFTANKNSILQDISRVASGGEMSRLMLCIKSLLSDASGLPTIIFDEIDSGVSGDTAERVGNIIRQMSGRMQIINITHLPQVASKGNYHYLVYKTEEEKSTITRMKLLSSGERQLEIAKMLSGEEITSAAIENARELLGN